MTDAPRRWQQPPVYPLLFIAAIILGVFAESGDPVNAIWRPMLIALAVVGLAIALLAVVTRRPNLAAFVIWSVVAVIIDQRLIAIVILVPVGTVAVTLLRREPLRGVSWTWVTRVLNPIMAIFLVLGIFNAANGGALTPLPSIPVPAAGAAATSAVATTPASELPDIYLILLDGHPRADTAANEFGVDSSAFLASMEELGFKVADGSHSNYNATLMTVSSMLTGRNVNDLVPEEVTGRLTEIRGLTAAINGSQLLGTAKAAGYSITAVASPFVYAIPWSADRVIGPTAATDLELSLLRQGLGPTILPDLQRSWLLGLQRQGVMDAFASARAIADEPSDGPKLVLTHVLAPHPPLLFNADGSSAVDGFACFPVKCGMWDRHGGYGNDFVEPAAEQFQSIDQQVLDTVKHIQATSKKPPVIIVFSDHGFRHDATDTQEQLRNMFLSYTPDHPDLFPSNTTLINTLPKLLNAYAGTSIPLMPEQSYASDLTKEAADGFLPVPPIQTDP